METNIYRKERIMEKRMLWLGLMLMVVGLCSSGALAATLGPPAAGLDAGQFRVGVDISSSQTGIDIDVESTSQVVVQEFTAGVLTKVTPVTGEPGKFQFKDKMQNEMVFANLGYGIVDKLEVYLLLGVSDLGFDDDEFGDGSRNLDNEFGSSDELAYGFGVKGTIFDSENVTFGAQLQMTWASFEGDLDLADVDIENETAFPWPGNTARFEDVPGTYEIDYYQLKIAVGPTYKLTETISIYGGPFYQLMNGTLDMERSDVQRDPETGPVIDEIYTVSEENSIDITERSRYGIYFGAQINCMENLPLCVECQTSNETYVVGASLSYRF
jgi:hypothetical protein